MEESKLKTGSVIQLQHVQSGIRFRFIVECKGQCLILADPAHPYQRLRAAQNGQMTFPEQAAKDSLWELETLRTAKGDEEVEGSAASVVRVKASNGPARGMYLAVEASQLVAVSTLPPATGEDDHNPALEFLFAIVAVEPELRLMETDDEIWASVRRRFTLSELELRQFIQSGYLHKRNVVPVETIRRARRVMNHALGVPGMVIPGGDGGSGKLEGRVTNSDEIRALLSREVVYVLEQLLGDGKFVSPQGAQLALRFPELCTDSWVGGRSWHTDGLRQRKPHPFSLLLGVAISATTQEDCGNLCIWPGSHILTHRWTNWEDGTICTTEFGGDADRLPDLGRPVQICANEGDIVILHPNLAHAGGPNLSPDIRYHVYFRIAHLDFTTRLRNFQTDLWADLDGVRHLADCVLSK